ncbi:hypothetical protein [Arthrobacter sp. zg-Y750]|uniref:hypothetical protein n=1 Tax=Arthrobacter sp. zg-Y750 TaxID=2894189 RepID=UPI001E607908|nr:hypothetical protein [Arthrobacter sp. zg-Y750]
MPGLYNLPSCWLLPAGPEEIWALVAGSDMSWPRWWPGCTLEELTTAPEAATGTDDARLLATTAALQFRAALGYRLSISIRPTRADFPRLIEFDAGGDLVGTGRIRLAPDPRVPQRTRMLIDWRVTPTRPWMRLLTPVARPVFTAAHSMLMRRGEQGLRRELRRNQATRQGRPNSVRTPVEKCTVSGGPDTGSPAAGTSSS